MIICPSSGSEDEVEPSRPTKNSIHQFRNAVERGCIPDAKIIYELKKQRQKLAKTSNEDFIPLENTEDDDENKSRLLREEDHDKSDYEDDEEAESDRIQFGKVDYETQEREKNKEQFRLAQEEKEVELLNVESKDSESDYDDNQGNADHSDSESEDELERWEREQIRKVVKLQNILSYESDFNNRFVNDVKKASSNQDDHNVVPIEIDNQETKAFGTFIPAFILESANMQQNENFATILDKLTTLRSKILTSIEDHGQQSDRINMDLKLIMQSINLYESNKSQFAEDYNFYRNTLDFARNLCDCINDKLVEIEKYEQDILELYAKHSTKLQEQRRKETQEQNQLCLQLISNHTANCLAFRNTTVNSIFEILNDDPKKLNHASLREKKYRKFLSTKTNCDIASDDEDCDQLNRDKLKVIEEKLSELFEDTDGDYATVGGILKQFEIWRQTRLSTYNESFVTEFIPKFLVYYIRYELTLWNLFVAEAGTNLTEIKGIRDLLLYSSSIVSEDKKVDPKQVVDLELVPTIIDTTILWKLSTLVERNCWNPLSTTQTKRLVAFLDSLLSKFPTLLDKSKSLPILLQNIMKQLENSIENDIFIPQYIPADFFDPSLSKRTSYESAVFTNTTTFFEHQYALTIKLMGNIIQLRTVINESFVKDLALNKLCNRYILMSIQRSSSNWPTTVGKLQTLVGLLPKHWRKLNEPVILKLSDLIQQLIESPSLSSLSDITAKLISVKLQLTT